MTVWLNFSGIPGTPKAWIYIIDLDREIKEVFFFRVDDTTDLDIKQLHANTVYDITSQFEI